LPDDAMPGRSGYVDFSKGILILLVVIGHSIQYVAYQGAGFWDAPLFKAIYMFHMPLFMGISGYVSTRSLVSVRTLDLVRAKVPSYVGPIFVWCVLYLSLVTLLDRSLPSKTDVLSELLARLWFLWALVGSLVLTSVARAFGRFWAIAAVLLFLALLAVRDIAMLHLFKYTYPFFFLGHVIATKNIRAPSSAQIAVVTVVAGIGSAVCFALWHEETYIYVSKMAINAANVPNIALRYIAGVLASTFALCLFYGGYRLTPDRLRNAVTRAGSDSIFIYILSSYAFILLLQLASKFLVPPKSSAVVALISVVAGCAITYVCWLIGHRISANPTAARVLFGKQAKSTEIRAALKPGTPATSPAPGSGS
jgi:fucose 4-O-acetylase-like acetyltransferase